MILKALLGVLKQHRRGKGHELRALKAVVEPIIHGWVGGLVQDRAVTERSWAVFHPSVKTGNDVALRPVGASRTWQPLVPERLRD